MSINLRQASKKCKWVDVLERLKLNGYFNEFSTLIPPNKNKT